MLKSVRVGGLKFKVKIQAGLQSAEGVRLLGEADYAAQTIKLDPQQAKAAQRVTLMHEITHLIMSRSGLEYVYTHETLEQLCEIFGYAFLDLVRDNPKLIKYLRE